MSTGNANPCHSCRANFHAECTEAWTQDIECCCDGEVKFDQAGNVSLNENNFTDIENDEIDKGYIEVEQGFTKSLSEYTDPISTGRKKAAQLYPIAAGMVCEWAGLAKAGGGIYPIVGCVGRAASDRHHGPDKNTMNNAPQNLHRICDHCHNTWHALNDEGYGERPPHTQPFIPTGKVGIDWFEHDSVTKATTAEILEAEAKRLNA